MFYKLIRTNFTLLIFLKMKLLNFSFVFLLLYLNVFSKNTEIDKIIAIIGDEIILESNIQEITQHIKEEEEIIEKKCQFLENILLNKILLFHAKQDTLIKISQADIKNRMNEYISMYLQQVKSEKALLEVSHMSSMEDLQSELMSEIENHYYSTEKRKSIIQGVDVGPLEVKAFFEEYKSDLPDAKDEVSLAHIILYPEIKEESKNNIIERLKSIKTDVENGVSTFENQAKIYSQDPISASKGGLYAEVKRGSMIKEFDAIAFSLDEKQISDPFRTEFGYHIIKLEKKKGHVIDLRHILLELTPNQEEIEKTKSKLDSIRVLIKEGKISFKEAALKFSNDNNTRFNGGLLHDQITGSNRLERLKLNTKEIVQIAGLSDGGVSDVFEDELKQKKVVRLLQLIESYPEHQLDLEKDYTRIKDIVINKKKNDILQKWTINQIPNTFIYIQKEYQNCDFEINWLNHPKFVAKTILFSELFSDTSFTLKQFNN